jgi:HlyD family secretion protein
MCFCEKLEIKLKYALKTGIQDDTNIEVKSGLKRRCSDYGPYTTVSKELNSNDMVYIKSRKKKKNK